MRPGKLLRDAGIFRQKSGLYSIDNHFQEGNPQEITYMRSGIIKIQHFLIFSLVLVSLVLTGTHWNYATAEGPVDPVNKSSNGLALKGYDVVAYFVEGKPVKGRSEFTHDWNGAKWYFSSGRNRDLFAANPEKYAPQYGGYCAFGVSKGYAVDVDPNAWKIVDAKLYLNYDKEVAKTWEKDTSNHIKKADENWPRLVKPRQ
jgi:YHS domain-containing protein